MKKIVVLTLCLFLFHIGFTQNQKPFWNEVQHFKSQDSIAFPAKGQVLFIGSSSFTLWKDAQRYFPESSIINRAFGGSQLVDQIYYIKDIVYPYHPKQIVLYCGENDIAASDTVTAQTVLYRFKTLYHLIRKKHKKIPIIYVSIKPSPSRMQHFKVFEESNQLIKKFIASKKRIQFIDVFHLMLDKNNTPLDNIFLQDKLHMNASGYQIWQKALQPFLLKTKK